MTTAGDARTLNGRGGQARLEAPAPGVASGLTAEGAAETSGDNPTVATGGVVSVEAAASGSVASVIGESVVGGSVVASEGNV